MNTLADIDACKNMKAQRFDFRKSFVFNVEDFILRINVNIRMNSPCHN